MNRRILVALPLAVLAACSGTDSTSPSVNPQVPQFAIQDGAHSSGNPDFFFLPPVVLPTGPLTNWTPNGFNGLLSPSVEVCRLVATTVAAVATPAGSACLTPPVILSGSQVKKHFPPVSDPTDVISGLPGDWAHYHAAFPIPNNCTTSFFYRVRVKVGTVELGYADVQCITNILQLLTLDYKKFGPALKGLPLQIPFRIEKFALCTVPGVGPCSSAQVDLTTATAPVTISLPPKITDPTGSGPSGVILSPQTLPPTVFTVEDCADLNSRATDLPTFGRCIRITSNPALPPAGLAVAASVFVCNLGTALPPGMTHEQSELITLHRYDATPTPTLTALPHAPGCPQFDPIVTGSIGGLLRDLVNGRVTAAGNQLLALIGPKPAYARRLNQGGGGLTSFFSDFQFTLPAYMTIESVNPQIAPPGTPVPSNPTVMVRDLSGNPVAGARVTFAPANGSAIPLVVVTGGSGLASTGWTLGASPGSNSLVASGRGIAGADNNGPRATLDPFQPIQTPFDPGATLPTAEVLVKTGSQTFSATGADSPIPVPFGSTGYDYLILNPPTTPPPAGWETVAFIPTGWSNGGTPFVGVPEANPQCGYGTGTTWGLNTDILVRKSFNLGSSHNVIIRVAIDNDVQEVFLNGNQLSDGAFVHEGCAGSGTPAPYAVYFGTAQAGSNLIAIHGKDRGRSSYLDVQVELDDSCEFCESGFSALRTSGITASDLVVGPRPPRLNQPSVRKPQVVQPKGGKRANQ